MICIGCPADFYFLMITEAEEVLSKEDDTQFSVFLEILQKAAVEWTGGGENLEEIRRSPVRFYVVFQVGEHASSAFTSRLELTGATYQYLHLETK